MSFRRLLLSVVLLPLTAHAGLSLDEALARQHDSAPLTSFEPDDATPDGIAAAVGGTGESLPPMLRPLLPGDGGIQWTRRGGSADGLQWRAGVGWRDTDAHSFSLDGSEVSLPLGPGRVYASVQRRHWGLSWVGSLILDSAAPALPAIGWHKTDPTPFETRWLSWLGPWSADVFFGRLSGHVQPEHPNLIGGRLQLAPLPNLELGLSRTIQWGGTGRPESFHSLLQALLGHDNVNPADDASEPGNQLGGFDGRYTWHLRDGRTVSAYFQAIGEDEAGGWPSHYLGSLGIDTSFAWRGATWRLFAETADTVAGGFDGEPLPGVAYRHHIYLQGYTEQGKSLGFPAGGDVTLNTLGALVDAGRLTAMLMLHDGRAHEDAQFYATQGPLRGADATLGWRLDDDWRVGASIDFWHDPVHDDQVRGQLWLQHRLP